MVYEVVLSRDTQKTTTSIHDGYPVQPVFNQNVGKFRMEISGVTDTSVRVIRSFAVIMRLLPEG